MYSVMIITGLPVETNRNLHNSSQVELHIYNICDMHGNISLVSVLLLLLLLTGVNHFNK